MRDDAAPGPPDARIGRPGRRGLAEFGLDVRLSGGQVAAAGNTTVAVGDYRIEVPQGAAGLVSVEPRVTLEISLVLLKR